jgi:putative OPT family oligopeptide transporter
MSRAVSHEEPDIEVPESQRLQKELTALGATRPDAPVALQGNLTWQSIASGVLVAMLMGLSYPYMVLKLGFGPNVSVVAAFFGFLFLRLLDNVLKQRHYSRWQNNIVEAAGTSASQTAFMCVLLGAFDLLHSANPTDFALTVTVKTVNGAATLPTETYLTPWMSFLWLTAAATLGTLLAVPLRRHFVVDEKLPYVDGMAAAETIIVLDPPVDATAQIKRNALKAFNAVMIGVALSGFIMLLREDVKFTDVYPESIDLPWIVGSVVMAKMAVGASFSLLSVGSGMLVGLRINVSMMIGATLAWVIAPYFLVKYGELPHDPKRTQVLFWVMWPATGMLVAGGLTALALRWKLLVDTFRSLRKATIGGNEFPLSFVIVGVVISSIALCFVQNRMFSIPIWMTVAAILLSIPLMLVGLRVLGETNWGPISALSNMMQGLFAAVAPGNITANMIASGTTGTVATSSEAIMQDYKCGELVGTKPRNLTIMQLLGVPIGAAMVSLIYPKLVGMYGIVDTVNPATGETVTAGLTSPISNKWSGFAQILKQGVGALPTSALYALIVFSILGIVLTVLESNKRAKPFVPSPTGVGIGILVPFSVVFTMFLGGVAGAVWERKNKKSADMYLVPFGSGLIAGEALVAVFAAVYFAIKDAL